MMKRQCAVGISLFMGALAIGMAGGCGEGSPDRDGAGLDPQVALGTVESRVEESRASDGFVRVEGTHFVLDGKKFYFQGTNFQKIANLDGRSEADVYQKLKAVADAGLKVVRFWGFSCKGALCAGEGLIQDMSKDGIVYNERGLQRLDVVLDAARVAGLKLILTLVNFEDAYCGISWWTEKVLGDHDKQKFYTDETLRKLYKQYASDILNRINTRYQKQLGKKIAYKDDPTIMAIELENEPHTDNNYELSRGWKPGQIVYKWLKEMSEYVSGIDTRHLIATGEEGYKISHTSSNEPGKHSWLHGGLKGVDFASNVTLPKIDFVTVHFYPDNWEIPAAEILDGWVRDNIVYDRARIAHQAGKPIVMEESGFTAVPFSTTPDDYRNKPVSFLAMLLDKMYQYANEADYAGTMVWQAFPDGEETDRGYEFNFDDPRFDTIQRQADFMNRKSKGEAVTPTPSPVDPQAPECRGSSDSDPDRDGWGWESGKKCKMIYCLDAGTDTNRDGWGWENNRSCRVPFCLKVGSDPDGDGWGWEANMSCLSHQ